MQIAWTLTRGDLGFDVPLAVSTFEKTAGTRIIATVSYSGVYVRCALSGKSLSTSRLLFEYAAG